MPEEQQLLTTVMYKRTGSRQRLTRYQLRLRWDQGILRYKKRRWMSLDFRNVQSWTARAGRYLGKIADAKWPPMITLRTTGRQDLEERKFYFRHEDFENWLYWIIRSLLKYSDALVPQELVGSLSLSRTDDVRAARRLRAFDRSHEVFLAVSRGLDQAKRAQRRAPARPIQEQLPPVLGDVEEGELPPIVGPEIKGQTQRGIRYGQIGGKIGKGGSDATLFEVMRLLDPILEINMERGAQLARREEPMAVKVADTLVRDESFPALARQVHANEYVRAGQSDPPAAAILAGAGAGTRLSQPTRVG